MKLNIIIPLYNPTESIKTTLSNLLEQKNKNFNLHIIIDNPSSEHLEEIYEIRNLFENKNFLITINSKHQSINKVIYEALLDSNEEYSFIFYPDTEINSNWVENILNVLNKNKVDVVETRAMYRGYVKHDEKIKPLENKIYNLSKNENPVVFSSPVMFNKVVKTNLLTEMFTNWKTFKSANREYSIDINYSILLSANTYFYTSEIETYNWNYTTQNINIKSLKNEWKLLQPLFEKKYSNLELWEFCKFYNYQIFVAGYLGYIKYWKMRLLGKNLNLKGIKDALVEQLENIYKNKEVYQNNKYIMSTSLQSLVDEKYKIEENWNDIFYKFL
ncbi:glycosyltransferase family A protein [Mycoplasma zalophi]|uniref:Glycosyltransferase family 2 protein n=1 Tax=Mycoplasma zalophi TaxID=191287 RepID=A0ABS6DP76_9MOLU|nr:glycosyltransferase family 2 protein [Mycoplasma zalophi]MBU4691099.1 glycosyltransferase family 2 protein [Mycoplasma zalophi]MBU4692122.1 glycosyltransferase family 2 protein [Mycoplasma zalophi]